MKCTLIILFTFLALSTALKCQQCTGPGIFSLCNGIDDNGIEVDCKGANDMGCYYSTFPIDGKTLNFHYSTMESDLLNSLAWDNFFVFGTWSLLWDNLSHSPIIP